MYSSFSSPLEAHTHKLYENTRKAFGLIALPLRALRVKKIA